MTVYISEDKLRAVRRVIAHGGKCPDGRASAMIVNDAFRTIGQDVKIEFIAHGTKEHEALEPEPGLMFVDFSVPPTKADSFLAAGTLILDHHAGKNNINKDIVLRFVDAGLGAFGDEVEHPGVCGAVLAYVHVWAPLVTAPVFEDHDILKQMSRLAGIRDTWQNQHQDWIASCEQGEALGFWPEDRLLEAPISAWPKLLELGPILWARKMKTSQKVAEGAYRWVSQEGTRVCIFQGTRLSSDVAEALGSSVDLVIGFDITYENGLVKMLWSTRSHTDFNCVHFCGSHGGGGHTKAAGFYIALDLATSLNPYQLAIETLDNYEAQKKGIVHYNKLIRSKTPEILAKKGVSFETTQYTDEEYVQALHNKLLEETKEYIETPTTEELADVLEAVETLQTYHPTLKAVQRQKLEERGSFRHRTGLKWSQTKDSNGQT